MNFPALFQTLGVTLPAKKKLKKQQQLQNLVPESTQTYPIRETK